MSQVRVNTIVDANSGNTAQINGMTPTADSLQGFRNRIINGNMVIDQRNAGASVTFNDGVFVVDRFGAACSQTSKATAQRSTTAPTGFNNSVLITSSSAYTVTSTDFFNLFQNIEGFNVSDLGWGTAGAQAITLSFWVRSSLTGTFGGSISNAGLSRSYPFTYTINASNTFEQKTITIPGDTSGTWATDNGLGLRVYFGLGVGATYSGTAGAWAGTRFQSATGAVSVVGTSGATFYITGVQLEAGSVATPFERRDYTSEFVLCQWYYREINLANLRMIGAANAAGWHQSWPFTLPDKMRTSPTWSANLTTSSTSNLSLGPTTLSATSNVYVIYVISSAATGLTDFTFSASAKLIASAEL
jgi:hypothetical protein